MGCCGLSAEGTDNHQSSLLSAPRQPFLTWESLFPEQPGPHGVIAAWLGRLHCILLLLPRVASCSCKSQEGMSLTSFPSVLVPSNPEHDLMGPHGSGNPRNKPYWHHNKWLLGGGESGKVGGSLHGPQLGFALDPCIVPKSAKLKKRTKKNINMPCKEQMEQYTNIYEGY